MNDNLNDPWIQLKTNDVSEVLAKYKSSSCALPYYLTCWTVHIHMNPSNEREMQRVLDTMQKMFPWKSPMKKEECEELEKLAKYHAVIDKLVNQTSSSPEEKQS